MGAGELATEAQKLRQQIAALTRSGTTREAKNLREGRNIRKALAVVLTILTQQETSHE